MAETTRRRRSLDALLSIGAYPGEPETQRGGRRVIIVTIVVATLITIPVTFADLRAGYSWVATINAVLIIAAPLVLFAIRRFPHRFAEILTAFIVLLYLAQLTETTLFGGLFPSGLSPVFGLLLVLGALVAIGLRAAIVWFVAFVASVVYALLIPNLIGPIYTQSDPEATAAFYLVAMGFVTLAVLAYFVRQRDLFQQRSDDLLHNILPDEIVSRLKDEKGPIAEDYRSVSVLFADVVDFTPLSATLSPGKLVSMLADVFTTFDRFVAEVGLEKIKTVGDAYMAAAGVPRARDDHALAIAELALRIRDHVETNPIHGHRLSFRIGIDSGPVTAGIIGTHKFAYDLWGDTVNTASRMESSGVPGQIQITRRTFELLRDAFVCEPRGSIQIKGKSAMETYLLVSRRGNL